MRTKQYDPRWRGGRGYYQCPGCAEVFLGRKPPQHHPGCYAWGTGYRWCIYYFGPRQVMAAVRAAELTGPKTVCAGISVDWLRRHGLAAKITECLGGSQKSS